MIEARDVVKRYETGGETVVALDGVDVAVESGEFVSVVGPSGSGKSTLLNVLGLLDVPSEGSILLEGEAVEELGDRERTRARKRTIGFVFQDFHLVPTLTAQENVEVPRLFDREPDVTADRAADLLSRFGLADRLDHYPNELSGGQKQRVAIARALINEPSVVLADEPTGNLDQDTGRSILDTFQEICDDGVAVIAVTHDELVTDYTDRTLQLIDGVIDPDGRAGMSSSREVAGP
jgi:putative ABC transport system ATP-binding protein